MGLTNSQYMTLMRIYDQRRLDRQLLIRRREQEIREKLPAYDELSRRIVDIYAEQTKAAVSGQDRHKSVVQAEIRNIEHEQRQLLANAGYPDDYLDPPYVCPHCHDTGFVNGQKCVCFRQLAAELLYQQSGLREILARENFEHFDIRYYSGKTDPSLGISPRENMNAVLKKCHEFIDHFDGKRNILFYGKTGVGKTFLTNCITKEMIDRCRTVISISAIGLVDVMEHHTFDRGAQTDPAEQAEDRFPYIEDCDLLIIDDLGTELSNSFVTGQLFYLLNKRMNASRSTIISTNLSLDALQKVYSERIFSRIISAYDIMMIIGDDIRVRKAIGGAPAD